MGNAITPPIEETWMMWPERCGEVLKRAGVPCGSCDAVTALERRLRPYSAKAPRGTCDEPYPRHDGSSRSIAAGGRRSVDLSGRGHRKVVRLRAVADMSS